MDHLGAVKIGKAPVDGGATFRELTPEQVDQPGEWRRQQLVKGRAGHVDASAQSFSRGTHSS